MCHFMSAIVMKSGDVLHHPMLDSHSDILRHFEVRDGDAFRVNFAKVELTPNDNWLDPSTWAFKVDEQTIPDWLDQERARKRMEAIASKMIVSSGNKKMIVDGCWIVGGDARVSGVRFGRIIRVQDQASITGVGGRATIAGVCGHATIEGVWDHASIAGVGDQASIEGVRDHVTITDVSKTVVVYKA